MGWQAGRQRDERRDTGQHPITAQVRRQRVTLVTGFMIGLDATVMTTTLPTIHTDLHAKYLDPGAGRSALTAWRMRR